MKKKKICSKTIKQALACYLNLPKHLSNHLFGYNHSQHHRLLSGGIIIFLGTMIGEVYKEVYLLHIVFTAIGMSMHGIGLTPIIDHISKVEPTNNISSQSSIIKENENA